MIESLSLLIKQRSCALCRGTAISAAPKAPPAGTYLQKALQICINTSVDLFYNFHS